jgi:hypothetical protein
MPHIALYHYGRNRVHDVELGEHVPCFKLGNGTQAAVVMLAMGNRARRVVRKGRTHYHYIQINDDAHPVNHKGWLILEVDEPAVYKIEGLTRIQNHMSIYRYNDDTSTWERFPEPDDERYTPMADIPYAHHHIKSLGSYHPNGAPDIKVADKISGNDLTATRTQRSEHETPWWWIDGDTFPHKDVFKANGGRWSRKRRQWYFITPELPAPVLALLDDGSQSPAAPDPDEPPAESDEPPAAPAPVATEQPPARETGKPPSAAPPQSPAEPAAAETIEVPEEVAAAIKQATSIALKPGEPVAIDTVRDLLRMAGNPTFDSELPDELVIKPERVEDIWTQPDSTAGWKRTTTTLPATASMPCIDSIYQMPTQYVGRVAVAGECMVFGLAIHNSHPIYLNLVGAGSAVEAVWARLAQGKEIIISPDSGPSIPVKPKEKGQYDRFQTHLGNLGTDNLILLHRDLLYPTYDELSTTFIIYADEEQFTTRLGQHLNDLLDIAVFPEWYPHLRQIAEATGSARPCQSHGGTAIWSLTLDQDRWTRTIQYALEKGELAFPETRAMPAFDNAAIQAFYELLQDETTAAQLDKAILAIKKHEWRGNLFKEREIKLAIKQVLGPQHQLIDRAFEIAKAQPTY